MWNLIENPYDELSIDLSRYNPDEAQQLLLKIANALIFWYQKSSENRNKIINLGSRKAEGYDEVNKERYDIDNKMEALRIKWNTINQIIITKSTEMKYLLKGR
jgi:hypothetical protein